MGIKGGSVGEAQYWVAYGLIRYRPQNIQIYIIGIGNIIYRHHLPSVPIFLFIQHTIYIYI